MITIKDCTIRYLLGPSDIMESWLFDKIKYWTDFMNDLLPTIIFHDDGEHIWAYCTYPVDRKCEEILTGFLEYDFFCNGEILN